MQLPGEHLLEVRRLEGRLEGSHPLAVGLHADALVDIQKDLFALRTGHLDRKDLLLEVPGLGGGGRLDVGAIAEIVGLIPRDVPLRRDEISGDPLGNQLPLVPSPELRPEGIGVGVRRPHGDARHVLDARGDHQVVRTGHHPLSGEVDGLLGGSALAVDRGGGDGLGEPGGQPGVAADVEGLLPHLRDTSGDVVLDQSRIDPRPGHDLFQDLGQEIHRMDVLERAVPLADRAANGLDDDRVSHLRHGHPPVPTPPAAGGLPGSSHPS